MSVPGRRPTDRHDLYEIAAQAPEASARFLEALHPARNAGGLVLGEDFSGAAGVARAWLRRSPDASAVATDLDAEPLEHARRRAEEQAIDRLDERFTLDRRDVRESAGRADVVAALNFAVCELGDRSSLLTYLRHTLLRLGVGGVFVCDVYAGADALSEGDFERDVPFEPTPSHPIDAPAAPVRYTWSQLEADAVRSRVRNAMSFALADGRRFDDAFEYDWRLWGVAELRDAMRDAGFPRTEVHTSLGAGLDGDGNLLTLPDDSDEPGFGPGSAPEPGEPVVAYVVGRV